MLDETKIISCQSSVPYICSEGEVLKFNIEEGIILFAHHGDTDLGGAIHLPFLEEKSLQQALEDFLYEIIMAANCSWDHIEVKLVGPKNTCLKLRHYLSQLQQTVKSEYTEHATHCDIFYFTATGRLSVQRSEPDSPVDTTPAELDVSRIVAIGASTGGVDALIHILSRLPEVFPPILITQHMHPDFLGQFIIDLNKYTALKVQQAEQSTLIEPGNVYVAGAKKHLTIKRVHSDFMISLDKSPPISGHLPSVDALFASMAKVAKEKGIGVILTGMGKDGAIGLKQMRDTGAHTMAQNKESCVVYGMPKQAVELGGAVEICRLEEIASRLIHYLTQEVKRSA